MKVEVDRSWTPLPKSPYGLCGRKATLNDRKPRLVWVKVRHPPSKTAPPYVPLNMLESRVVRLRVRLRRLTGGEVLKC